MNRHRLTYLPGQVCRLPRAVIRLVFPLLLLAGLFILFGQKQFLIPSRALAYQSRGQYTIWLQASPGTDHSPPLSQPLLHGNPHLPEVALTFDDGPQPTVTPQVLAILRRFHIKATFFSVGQLVKNYPNIVAQEKREGNLVGDHSWSHPNLNALDAAAIHQQVAEDAQAIQQATGTAPTFFRPPYGERNASVTAQTRHLGLSTILWNVDPQDWARPGTDTISARVLQATTNGSIILLHDGGGNRAQTLAALPTIIRTLQQRGLHFVTIKQMAHNLASTGPQQSINLSK